MGTSDTDVAAAGSMWQSRETSMSFRDDGQHWLNFDEVKIGW